MTYDSIGDIPVSELAHFGVKGMKWGVRKDRPNSEARKATRKADRLDKKIKRLDQKLTTQIEWNFGAIAIGGELAKPYIDAEIQRRQKADKTFRKSKMTDDEIWEVDRMALNKALVKSTARGAVEVGAVMASGFAATQLADLNKYGVSEAQAATAVSGLMAVVGGRRVQEVTSILEAKDFYGGMAVERELKRERDRLRRVAKKSETSSSP